MGVEVFHGMYKVDFCVPGVAEDSQTGKCHKTTSKELGPRQSTVWQIV